MANVIFVKPVSREEKNCLANGCPPRVFWTGPYSGGAVLGLQEMLASGTLSTSFSLFLQFAESVRVMGWIGATPRRSARIKELEGVSLAESSKFPF